MVPQTFASLNTTDERALLEFERALFQAFSTTLADPILKDIWDVDVAGQRIRTKVPYANQLIHVARINGVIAAGAAANLDVKGTWQLDMLGFAIDKTQPHICEALVIFNNQRAFNDPSISLFEMIGVQVAARLRDEHGIHRVYGSCPSSKLEGYLLYGWNEIGHRDIEGSREHLLEHFI